MGYTYTKLFSGLTESTVWIEPYATRVLWVSMLSWADQHGRVFGSVPGIARRAGIQLEECEAALASFMAPDHHSRTTDHDGRRIEKIDGGWLLLNHGKYRAMRDDDARREYQREWDREKRPTRTRHNPTQPDNTDKNRPGPTYTEAEAVSKDLVPAARARPTLEQVKAYCLERQNTVDPEKWFNHYSANGWKVGRNPMRDWRAAVRTWEQAISEKRAAL
jgi:hypothetical protein